MLKSYKIYTCTNGTLGLHLSRAPWDPYPWVSSIQKDSNSYQAGLRIGDCLLELNGQDVLGMKISQIAALLKNHWLNESSNYVTVVIWRNKCNSNGNNENATHGNLNEAPDNDNDYDHDDDNDDDDDEADEENNAHNINQQSLQKFATCLQHIAQLLECPVCLEVIKPPGWQCCNGHVLCNNCRSRSEKCPVCRVPLGPRGRCLLSDKLFTLLADSFPCDGVRSNKNSPKDRRKCNTEFHNEAKVSSAQKHQQLHLQQQQENYEYPGVKKAKDSLLTSLRQRRRKLSNSKTYNERHDAEGETGETNEEQDQASMQKQAMYNTNDIVVVCNNFKRNGSNRKSAQECNSEAVVAARDPISEGAATTFHYNELQEQTSAIQQCHCVTCFKSDGFATVNNVATMSTTSATLNKYILRLPSREQLGGENIVQQQENEKKYQNYQCPTGKLCCLNLYVIPHATSTSTSTNSPTFTVTNNNNETTAANNNCETAFREPMTNNNLSTCTMAATTATVAVVAAAAATEQTNAKLTQTTLMPVQQRQCQHHQHLQNHQIKFHKMLKNEWAILTHLTEDHKLPVNQYYAEYGQRLTVPALSQPRSLTCLNLRGSDDNDAKVEKFFIACIPLQVLSSVTAATTTNLTVAIFLYHMNAPAIDNSTTTITPTPTTTTTTKLCFNDEVSNFETIIENPSTGIKWFGRAHPLTTPWSYIHEKQHFLCHNVSQNHLVAVSMNETPAPVNTVDDAFVIVVKRKLEIKTTN